MSDSTPAKPSGVEISFEPASTVYDPGDQRWRQQIAQLLQELKREGGDVRRENHPVPGQKGGVDALILALGTSGAITAAVTVFKAWLGRTADRSIRMKAKVGERVVEIELTGSNISEGMLRTALGLTKDAG